VARSAGPIPFSLSLRLLAVLEFGFVVLLGLGLVIVPFGLGLVVVLEFGLVVLFGLGLVVVLEFRLVVLLGLRLLVLAGTVR